MTQHWRDYVVDGVETAGGPIPFALTQWSYLSPVFSSIQRALPSGGKVLDMGCGAGIFTALLAHQGFHVVGVDEDPEIVSYARKMVSYFRSSARVEQASAFDLSNYHGKFDLVYSLGLVEHYEPELTVRLIREQARCGHFVLVAVPTRFTKYAAPVTNERLYRRRQVCALVQLSGMHVRESFVFGDVPTSLGRTLERVLPKVVFRKMRHALTYGMSISCLGECK